MAELMCPECARMVTAESKVNFLGFPKFQCPACRHEATHPLAAWRLVIYALIAVGGVVGTVVVMVEGGLPIMGVIPALMLAAVVMNFGVNARLDAAYKRAGQRPR